MSEKFCNNDHAPMTCVKTGCTVLLSTIEESTVDGKPAQMFIHGDLFWCRRCESFQLFGARIPYYSNHLHADATVGEHQMNTDHGDWKTLIGYIRVNTNLRQNFEKWYPEIVHVMDEKELWYEENI
jgi:hypothetical protein